MNSNQVYLLAIRGTLAPKQIEIARTTHNQTAGDPQSVATARALGDLSHMVYVPLGTNGSGTSEFLILDLWNSMEGLNQFFANPHVQEGGSMIFAQRDPVVCAPAEGFFAYHFPAPTGKNDRFVGLVRGPVHSRESARQIHNNVASKMVNRARMKGNLSHDAYFLATPPGTPESLEFVAVDVWMDADGMASHYSDPEFLAAWDGLFTRQGDATVWVHPAGEWVEW